MLAERTGRVGNEVEALCGRCGNVWHVVVALAEGRVAQVECGECRARHRYRAPGGAAARGPRERAPAPRRNASGARRAPEKPIVTADLSRAPRPFSPRDTYRVGDRLLHPAFGEGVVQALLGAKKMEVLFAAGAKRLVQGLGER